MLYLISISFEDRCLAVLRDLPPNNANRQALILDFLGYENISPYIFNKREALSILKQKGYPVHILDVELTRPLQALLTIEGALARLNVRDVVFDISTMPRNYLFGICKLLSSIGLPTTIRYYRPGDYGTELSRGIGEVSPIPGFEGNVSAMGDTVLAVVLGFEGYKALTAWERVGPSKVIPLIGQPAYIEKFLDISRKQNSEFLEATGNPDLVPLHTHDVIAAKRQLVEVYARVSAEAPSSSLVVCPLGTKLQSLAVFGFAYQRPEVSVIYVSSLSYFVEGYSRGYQPEFSEFSLSEVAAP
jgi:hypothetical protein